MKKYFLIKALFLSVIFLLCVVHAAIADEPELKVSVDRVKIMIGDRIKYTAGIIYNRDIDIELPEFKDHVIGDFEIKDSGLVKKDGVFGSKRFTAWYDITTYNTGVITIPEYNLKYRISGDKSWSIKRSNSIDITVKSLISKERPPSDIKDIKGPLSFFEINWILIFILFIFFAVIIICIIFIRRHLARKPVKLPHETALEELEMARSRLLQNSRVEAYFVEISDIVRRYIERSFKLKAPEMTTEEFLNSLKDSESLNIAQKDLLKNFMNACDMVKFARYNPSHIEIENIYDAAKKFIEETKGY